VLALLSVALLLAIVCTLLFNLYKECVMLNTFASTFRCPLVCGLMLLAVIASASLPLAAEAHGNKRGHGHYKHVDYERNDRGYYRNDDRRWRRDDRPFFSTYGGKVVQGGLVGGGIGAATGVIFNKPVLKSTVIGGAVGAGVQAVRHSNW
jgi:hypothetical protein